MFGQQITNFYEIGNVILSKVRSRSMVRCRFYNKLAQFRKTKYRSRHIQMLLCDIYNN